MDPDDSCTESGRMIPGGLRPTIPDVIERFKAYHADHPVWGSLHTVLEDYNVHDSHVNWCLEFARENGDWEGAVLARVLLRMSKTQRSKIARMDFRE